MSPSTLSRSLPRWLFLMGALSAIGPFSVDMYLPAFPSIVKSLQVSSGEVERTLAAYLIGLALAQIFYGPQPIAMAANRLYWWACALYDRLDGLCRSLTTFIP
jgi:MFS family permease